MKTVIQLDRLNIVRDIFVVDDNYELGLDQIFLTNQIANIGYALDTSAVTLYDDAVYIDQFKKDIEFGKYLMETFLIDNRLMTIPVTSSDSIALLQKFQGIEALARMGDIKTIASLLPSIPTDNIYTEQRQIKYTKLLSDYLVGRI